jgi:purine-cytosine permease-like protein
MKPIPCFTGCSGYIKQAILLLRTSVSISASSIGRFLGFVLWVIFSIEGEKNGLEMSGRLSNIQ